MLALSGDLGAGKTTLARALIRAMAGDPALEVPSPTFTLVQSYEGRVPIHHFDLYRLTSPEELDELGLDEALSDGAALIEWPERAGEALPKNAIRIELTHRDEGRLAAIAGSGPAFERIRRSLEMRDFLERSGWGIADRAYFTGDASARSYEIVTLPGAAKRVLMNSPRLVLGPPVRGGKPYAEIAHSAQSVVAFIAVDQALRGNGFAVPEIYSQDTDRGFLLIEHLGDASFLDKDGQPIPGRYAAAAELLAAVHGKQWPKRIEVGSEIVYEIPPFDRAARLVEADLLVDWYIPFISGKPASDALRSGFHDEWNQLFDRVEHVEQSILLRDYHSPNLIWREDRSGHDRLGILDFQDALIGPAAYDVASLAMDARVSVSKEIEDATVSAYVAARHAVGGFDEAGFREAYAVMAAQRNSKILGIFVRLDRRDGKPAYLRHLPRIRDYLERALAHPALDGLRRFYRKHGIIGEEAV